MPDISHGSTTAARTGKSKVGTQPPFGSVRSIVGDHRRGKVLGFRFDRARNISNKQCSTMRDELHEPFALLPTRSEPRIWISKPAQSDVEKFICQRSVFFAHALSRKAISSSRPNTSLPVTGSLAMETLSESIFPGRLRVRSSRFVCYPFSWA
jgi:hypothetical protein